MTWSSLAVAVTVWPRRTTWPRTTVSRTWPCWRKAISVAVAPAAGTRSRAPLLYPEVVLLLPLMLVPFVALCVAVGMNWSLKARGVLGAVVPSVGIIGSLMLVLGFCGMNIVEGPFIGPVINALSPTTNLIMLVNPWETIGGFADTPGSGRINLALAAILAGAAYSVIVYFMIQGMVRGFDHTVRRLSGTG